MLPAEVVAGEMKREPSLQVVPLLAERLRQPREALAPLAQRSILPFDVRGGNPLWVWVSINFRRNRLYDVSGAVAFRRSRVAA